MKNPYRERAIRNIKACSFVSLEQQARWLDKNAAETTCRLFDEHGWKQGWQNMGDIAQSLFPTLKRRSAMSRLRATLAYLTEEGKLTGAPQVKFQRGQLRFDELS